MENKNYKNDKLFLQKHIQTVELVSGDKRLLVTPDLQGRVLTSSANGEEGYSFGWLNYDLIASGKFLPHCNNFGGEDRFWLGPEGGQFSIFFKGESGKGFDFDDWQAPALIDTDKWELVSANNQSVTFTKSAEMKNWSGKVLKCRLDRTVRLLDNKTVTAELGFEIPHKVDSIVFSSQNLLTNTGDFEWTKETGMLSIWILGQFIPSDKNTVIIPYKQSDTAKINDSYFGKIDADRLKVTDKELFFKGDGGKRGKIGTPPEMTIPIAGAYDAENGTLTVVKFSFYNQANDVFVNSMWEYQDEPFKGDVINSYNDGPLEDGSIMGPFYEIETSSSAADLEPNESLLHTHTTMHFKGDFEILNQISKQLLGVDLNEV
ncbi:MAG: hypothetical protein KA206_00640 [Paludibacter sp.]|nr:hypothetical protein [Paludibacter sp.]